jgi:hypothetical protein
VVQKQLQQACSASGKEAAIPLRLYPKADVSETTTARLMQRRYDVAQHQQQPHMGTSHLDAKRPLALSATRWHEDEVVTNDEGT